MISIKSFDEFLDIMDDESAVSSWLETISNPDMLISGETPLQIAAANTINPDVIRAIIKKGASLDGERRPLVLAARFNCEPECIKALLEADDNLGPCDSPDSCVPEAAAAAVRNDQNPECIKTILDLVPEITAFHAIRDFGIAYNRNPKCVRMMVNYLAEREFEFDCRDYLLSVGLEKNHDPECIMALREEAGHKVTDYDRNALLKRFIRESSAQSALRLICLGAEPDEEDKAQLTSILMYYSHNGFDPDTSCSLEDSFYERYEGDTDEFLESLIARLIEERTESICSDAEGVTTLMRASVACNGEAELKALLESGKQNLEAHDSEGRTALHYAAAFNLLPGAVEQLLEFGADINAKDWDGRTALHLCVMESRNPKTAELLIKMGADLEARDNLGRTPLLCWAWGEAGGEDILCTLLMHGADIEAKDSDGNDFISPASFQGDDRESLVREYLELQYPGINL